MLKALAQEGWEASGGGQALHAGDLERALENIVEVDGAFLVEACRTEL